MYYEKYLKYKNKYLNLKHGGSNNTEINPFQYTRKNYSIISRMFNNNFHKILETYKSHESIKPTGLNIIEVKGNKKPSICLFLSANPTILNITTNFISPKVCVESINNTWKSIFKEKVIWWFYNGRQYYGVKDYRTENFIEYTFKNNNDKFILVNEYNIYMLLCKQFIPSELGLLENPTNIKKRGMTPSAIRIEKGILTKMNKYEINKSDVSSSDLEVSPSDLEVSPSKKPIDVSSIGIKTDQSKSRHRNDDEPSTTLSTNYISNQKTGVASSLSPKSKLKQVFTIPYLDQDVVSFLDEKSKIDCIPYTNSNIVNYKMSLYTADYLKMYLQIYNNINYSRNDPTKTIKPENILWSLNIDEPTQITEVDVVNTYTYNPYTIVINNVNADWTNISEDEKTWIKTLRISDLFKSKENFLVYYIYKYTEKIQTVNELNLHNLYNFINNPKNKVENNTLPNCPFCQVYNETTRCNIPTNHYMFNDNVYCVLLKNNNNNIEIPTKDNMTGDGNQIYYFITKLNYINEPQYITSFNNFNKDFSNDLLTYCEDKNNIQKEIQKKREYNEKLIKNNIDNSQIELKIKNNDLNNKLQESRNKSIKLNTILSLIWCGKFLTKNFMLSSCTCPFIINNIDATLKLLHEIYNESIGIYEDYENTFRKEIINIPHIQKNLDKATKLKLETMHNNTDNRITPLIYKDYESNVQQILENKKNEDIRRYLPTLNQNDDKASSNKASSNKATKIYKRKLLLIQNKKFLELTGMNITGDNEMNITGDNKMNITGDNKMNITGNIEVDNTYKWVLCINNNKKYTYKIVDFNLIKSFNGENTYTVIDNNLKIINKNIEKADLNKLDIIINVKYSDKTHRGKDPKLKHKKQIGKKMQNEIGSYIGFNDIEYENNIIYLSPLSDFISQLDTEYLTCYNKIDISYKDLFQIYENETQSLTPDQMSVISLGQMYQTLNDMVNELIKDHSIVVDVNLTEINRPETKSNDTTKYFDTTTKYDYSGMPHDYSGMPHDYSGMPDFYDTASDNDDNISNYKNVFSKPTIIHTNPEQDPTISNSKLPAYDDDDYFRIPMPKIKSPNNKR